MLELLKMILGLGGGTLVNKAAAVVNHAVFLPIIIYLIDHADKQIHMDTSLGFLAVVVACGYLLLETNRRSAPRYGVAE